MPEYDLNEIEAILDNFAGDVEKVRKAADKLSELSKYVFDKIREIKRELERLKRKYEKVVGEKVEVAPKDKNYGDIYLEATSILWGEILVAVKTNEEYDHRFFLDRLKIVVQNEDLIKIVMVNDYPTVEIRMNEIAGSLEDYANGVKKAREEFGVKARHAKTDWFWEEKYYGQARDGKPLPETREKHKKSLEDRRQRLINRYWETMNFRMDSVGKLAPFWELLDQGSIPMSSDRGGQPYPKGERTNFVDNARKKIQKLIKNAGGLRENEEEEVPDSARLQENIINTENMLKDYEEQLRKISDILDEAIEVEIDTEVYEEVSTRVFQYVDRVDRNKLQLFLNAVKTGDFSKMSVSADFKIDLTPPKIKGQPAPKRYRPRVTTVIREARRLGLYP